METDQKYSVGDFGAIDDGLPSGTYVRVRDDAMTADQQIRAKALECAVLLHFRKWELLIREDAEMGFESLYAAAEEFEHYIREDK